MIRLTVSQSSTALLSNERKKNQVNSSYYYCTDNWHISNLPTLFTTCTAGDRNRIRNTRDKIHVSSLCQKVVVSRSTWSSSKDIVLEYARIFLFHPRWFVFGTFFPKFQPPRVFHRILCIFRIQFR